jgi:hypothetical protein
MAEYEKQRQEVLALLDFRLDRLRGPYGTVMLSLVSVLAAES